MQRIEQLIGFVLIALVIAGCALVLRPFTTAILWAAILCYSTWPLFLRLEKKLKGRHAAAAGLMTLLITLVMVIPFTLVGFTFAESISRLAERVNAYRSQGIPQPPEWVQHIPFVSGAVHAYWNDLSQNTEKVTVALQHVLNRYKGWLLKRGIGFGQGVLQLILSVLIAFFFYRDGRSVASSLSDGIKRVAGDYSQRLMGVAGNTIKGVVYGLLGTALGQGVVAGIGFYVTGVPFPFLLGLLVFFLSLVPGGPPFVWVPASVWLFMTGSPGRGVFLLLWGLLPVSAIDHVLRPYLISRGSALPFVLVLLGVLGGILAFGFVGVFIGPTLLATGYSLVREFSSGRERTTET